MILKTYDKFLVRLFFKNLIQIFFIVFALVIIINLFEEIDFLKDSNLKTIYSIFLSLINTPSIMFDVFPFVFLISTQLFFIELIQKNEIQIFKYSGLTNLKILQTISITSLLTGIFIIFIFYNFSANLKKYYLTKKNEISNDSPYLASVTANGLWIKDGLGGMNNIINSDSINENFLINLNILQFDNDYNLTQTIISKKADITNKSWVLYDTKVFKNNEAIKYETLIFNTNFNLKKINSLFSNLSSYSLWELLKLKEDYLKLNYSTDEIDSHLNKLYSLPIYLTLITIFAAVLMFNIKYQKNTIYNIVTGIFFSVMIYYINYFTHSVGLNGAIPIKLSIWLPLFFLFLINFIGLVRINEK